MRIRRPLLAAFLASTLFCAGCVAYASAPFVHAIMGAEGDYVILDQSVAYFDSYSTLKIDPPASNMGEACPPAFLVAYEKGVTQELLKKPYFAHINNVKNPLSNKKDGKTLVLRSTVIDYSIGQTFNKVSTFGRNTFVIVRMEFLDKVSGEIVCTANVRGALKSAVHGEAVDLVRGVGRGLVRLFRDNHAPVG